jgi:HEAT repeat protein
LDQTIKPLASCLADKDPVVRYYASEALIAMADRSVPAVIEFLKSPRESERQRAARVLWRIGAPAVVPLIALVQDGNSASETRASAAHALGVIGDKRATKPLLSLLKDERYFVRQQAAWALGHMGEAAVTDVVEMARSSSPATREAAVEALGNIKSSGSIEALLSSLSDQNQNVRAAAVKALGETGDGRAVSHLVIILRDEASPHRSQAASALARLGKAAVPALVAVLEDSKPSVRQFAAEALGNTGEREAVDPLIQFVKKNSGAGRPEAIEALGKLGDPAALGAILDAMRGGTLAVRRKAVGALAQIADPKTVDALLGALVDPNEEVRRVAASALGEIGDARAVARLEEAADRDSSPDVRTAAMEAIERIRLRAKKP